VFPAVAIDLFSRQVVAWTLRDDMTRDIVMAALRRAGFRRCPGKATGLMFQSDRASQYASQDFRDESSSYGTTPQ